MNDLLTLVVPLLGRHSLTHEVLENLNLQKCEFKIIAADGSNNEFNKERIKKGIVYENLNIEYMYNGHDHDIHRYMNKMHNAFQKISTPFAMIFDNDDLIDLSGIRRGVYFMSNNLDYSSYRNDVRTLEISSYPEHPMKIRESLYTYPSIEHESAKSRLLDSVSHFNSFNYAIFRSEHIKCFFEIMNFFENNDYQLFAKGLAYFFSLIGKCKRLHDESYYYFLPGHTILQSGGKIHKFNEWIKTKFFEKSAPIMISMMSNLCMHLHKEELRDDFAKAFVEEAYGKFFSDVDISQHDIPIDSHIEKSKSFDLDMQKILSNYNFDDCKYDCEQSESKTNEEFVKWLSM